MRYPRIALATNGHSLVHIDLYQYRRHHMCLSYCNTRISSWVAHAYSHLIAARDNDNRDHSTLISPSPPRRPPSQEGK